MPSFLQDLPACWLSRYALPSAIRNDATRDLLALWAYDSTGLEGNTIDWLGTTTLLEHAVALRGHSLREHHEVLGHALAARHLLRYAAHPFGADDLKDLHRLLMYEPSDDPGRPHGDWKRHDNAVRVGSPWGETTHVVFSPPADTHALMESWLDALEAAGADPSPRAWSRLHTSFVMVHPFHDGNGRLARLAANLPRIRAGEPPFIPPRSHRDEYIAAIRTDTLDATPDRRSGLWCPEWRYAAVADFVASHDRGPRTVVEQAWELATRTPPLSRSPRRGPSIGC